MEALVAPAPWVKRAGGGKYKRGEDSESGPREKAGKQARISFLRPALRLREPIPSLHPVSRPVDTLIEFLRAEETRGVTTVHLDDEAKALLRELHRRAKGGPKAPVASPVPAQELPPAAPPAEAPAPAPVAKAEPAPAAEAPFAKETAKPAA